MCTIVIIEVPGGLLPIGDVEYFHFGELASVVSAALEIDSAIFNLYYNVCRMKKEERDKYFNSIAQHCFEKYHFPVAFYCISPQYVRADSEGKKAEFLHLNDYFIKEHWKIQDNRKACLWEKDTQMRSLVEIILKRLAGNIEIV